MADNRTQWHKSTDRLSLIKGKVLSKEFNQLYFGKLSKILKFKKPWH